MVTAAPRIFSQVKVSPSVSQAIRPATGGIRYMKGALRATPRTLLTQVQSSQPTNEHTTSAQKIAAHTGGNSYISTVWGRGYALRDEDAATSQDTGRLEFRAAVA